MKFTINKVFTANENDERSPAYSVVDENGEAVTATLFQSKYLAEKYVSEIGDKDG